MRHQIRVTANHLILTAQHLQIAQHLLGTLLRRRHNPQSLRLLALLAAQLPALLQQRNTLLNLTQALLNPRSSPRQISLKIRAQVQQPLLERDTLLIGHQLHHAANKIPALALRQQHAAASLYLLHAALVLDILRQIANNLRIHRLDGTIRKARPQLLARMTPNQRPALASARIAQQPALQKLCIAVPSLPHIHRAAWATMRKAASEGKLRSGFLFK
ncbi:MAG: hypothetical protein IKV82_06760 [Akkermansia sp.]|nr:hypothetical protein [Akkermansia sp.]